MTPRDYHPVLTVSRLVLLIQLLQTRHHPVLLLDSLLKTGSQRGSLRLRLLQSLL